jgi:hypothetical protein
MQVTSGIRQVYDDPAASPIKKREANLKDLPLYILNEPY